ncbi:Oxysterol-binding protein [Musa troglodytarum]|uniref:Oxysterol-binding protein n=1 Tax=Musa troglodytarum TaxID=320322 RepID=A0A9E7EAR1_9LILI|nr:Oxysterol-binding protein [Musa troglodytarum]
MENGSGGDAFGSSTAPLTWHDFLERMRHPSASDFVKSIKSFIISFSNKAPDPEKDSAAVQEFLANMEGAFRTHTLWAGSSEEELEIQEDANGDEELSEKMALLQQFVWPENLDVKKAFQNETSWLLAQKELQKISMHNGPRDQHLGHYMALLAQKELQKINMYKAPRDKLVCILNCCKVINNLLLNASITSNENPPGADEFLPVLIYVTIKANPPQLHSNLLYIQRYRRQSRLVSEAAYFFTNILSAESFIWSIDAQALSMEEAEFQRKMQCARAHLMGLSTGTEGQQPEPSQDTMERGLGLMKATREPDNTASVEGHHAPGQSYVINQDVDGKNKPLVNRLSISDLEKKGTADLLKDENISRCFQDYPFLFASAGDLTVDDVESLLNCYKQLVLRYVALSRGLASNESLPLPNTQTPSRLLTVKNSAHVIGTEMKNEGYEEVIRKTGSSTEDMVSQMGDTAEIIGSTPRSLHRWAEEGKKGRRRDQTTKSTNQLNRITRTWPPRSPSASPSPSPLAILSSLDRLHRSVDQMNPFCCSSLVPVSPAGATAPSPSPAARHPLPQMPLPAPPPPPPNRTSAAASVAPVRSRDPSPHHRRSFNDHNGGLRWPSTPTSASTSQPHGRHHRSATLPSDLSASLRSSFHDALDHREVQLNNIVGNGIAGILHKWVNYGKGWRPRWFMLQDGVLSYYKIHGPDRIEVSRETEKGTKVIGEESVRRISRRKNGRSHLPRKPVGEVHLKVSSIRESRSDDKRFSIFTGTKRLHLRAETREDRVAWMEALQAVKDMFPRISNSELMAPVDNVVVSTEKLQQRLQEEGVNETAIQDCEQIMRSEFYAMQNQLVLLKQKQTLLVDTLRQLETEKVDLENTLVDESQRQLKEHGPVSRSRHEKYSEGSASESDYDNERPDAAEEETDEEDNSFFDTRDFLSSSSFKSTESDFHRSEFDSDDENDYGVGSVGASDSSMKSVEPNYPNVRRREKLPDPIEKEKGVSLWSMIKDNIGKDLTKVCLPVYFNEPLSSLQKCFEELEYSYLIDRAYEWGKKGNGLMRILNVAAFAVSGYASTDGRTCKPFNPLLGETYEADYPDKGLRFFSEKVSHHPMIVACHCEGKGWKFWADSNLKSKFWGRSIQLDPVGALTLEFEDGEVFQWNKVTSSIYNLILGKLYCDHYGTMRIQGNHQYSCKLKFKEQSIIDRNPHQVQGIVQDRNGKTVATLIGKWDESMHYVYGDCSGKGKGSEPLSEAHLLWKRSKPPKCPTRYNLTRFAITMNELTPGLKEKLPSTDSRLRPDQRCLENGEYEMANAEKLRLEQRQRQVTSFFFFSLLLNNRSIQP